MIGKNSYGCNSSVQTLQSKYSHPENCSDLVGLASHCVGGCICDPGLIVGGSDPVRLNCSLAKVRSSHALACGASVGSASGQALRKVIPNRRFDELSSLPFHSCDVHFRNRRLQSLS